MSAMDVIREPVVSGSFYPANPGVLQRNINEYLDNAVVEQVHGEIFGVVSPHAGYMYSGSIAAYAYKAIRGREYDAVIVAAPSHRMYFQGVSILAGGGYRTPLGVAEVDSETAKELIGMDRIITENPEAHTGEHSLEIQIPFLQVVLKKFKIIPIIMGAQHIDICERLASCIVSIAKRYKKRFLIVGSTDLSHYYPYETAIKMDAIVSEHINSFSKVDLIRDLQAERCEACGAGPMITAMMVSESLGADRAKVLRYANSGDVSGDKSGVVGYMSAIFYREG